MSAFLSLSGLVWLAFGLVVLGLLALDLFVFHRREREVSLREAAIWSAIWIGLGLSFAVVVWFMRGGVAAGEYLAAYLMEESLSIDNLFAFALIFAYFAVPPTYQHRALFWGIVMAIAFRAVFIVAGAALLEAFHWIVYVFGALLLITSLKLAFQSEAEVHPEGNPVLRLLRRLMPMTSDYHGQHFFVRQAGRLMATPMLAVLVVVATTDVMFAIDSIPAAFSITRDTFLIIAANVCAVLGLRSLFFLLAHMLGRFAYLNYGLAAILAVAGVKFLISDFYHIPVQISLGVIVVVLAITIVASLRWPPRDEPHPEPERPAVHA